MMPGMTGPNSDWPLTVTISEPTYSIPELAESHLVHRTTGELVLTVRGHKDDVGRIRAAIQPVLEEMGFPACGNLVEPDEAPKCGCAGNLPSNCVCGVCGRSGAFTPLTITEAADA